MEYYKVDYKRILGLDYWRLEEEIEDNVLVGVKLYDKEGRVIAEKKSKKDFFVEGNTLAENIYAANMLVRDYDTGLQTRESVYRLVDECVNSAINWGRDYGNCQDCTFWAEFKDGSTIAIHNEGQVAFDAFVIFGRAV